MARSKRRSTKVASPERKAAQERRKLIDAATAVGVPEHQRQPDNLKVVTTAIIDGHTRPLTTTVAKLTRIERLHRSGSLSAQEAAACQWYADAHSLGFDTIGCTANYEGGSGGGGGSFDLSARYEAQANARDDYSWARKQLGVTGAYLSIFEQLVLGQEAIGVVAQEHFELARSQAEHRTRTILRFCANRLATVIAHLLPIEAEAPRTPKPVTPANDAPSLSPAKPDRTAQLFLDGRLAIARGQGTPGAIRIAEPTLAALRRETGCTDTYSGLPLIPVEGWTWGSFVISADEMALVAIVHAAEGTDQGTMAA